MQSQEQKSSGESSSSIEVGNGPMHFDNSADGQEEASSISDDTYSTQHDESSDEQDMLVDVAYYDPPSPIYTSSEIESEEECLHFSDKLSRWVAEHCITHRATNALLRLLLDEGLPVPLDRRTLCNSMRSVPVSSKCGGDYLYLGVKSGIETEFELGNFTPSVILDFGVDGIPIFKSRKSELWPILARFGSCNPFLVSCYYGRGKPNSAESFLEDLVEELNRVVGIQHKYSHQNYSVTVRCFVCDAPARAFLKGVISHTGYYSCERCTIRGTREADRVVFHRPENVTERDEESFRNFEYHTIGKCHQREESPLVRVPSLKLVKGFVLDSMHMVDLGALRRMLYSFKGKIKGIRRTKLSSQLLQLINSRLAVCNGKLPSEFNRQPRSLDDLDYWKATELRSFLLYTGMVVLKGVVADDVYEHFICLCLAVTLMSCPKDERRNGSLEFCRDLLGHFCSCAAKLYGGPFVVYNIHCLKHLPDDVENYNVPLQKIDAFSFENKLKDLKKSIKGPQNPLAQVYQKNAEKRQCSNKASKKIITKVSARAKDACFETDDKVLVVLRVQGDKCVCNAYSKRRLQNLFNKPKQSKEFGICYVPAKTKNTILELPKFQLVNKCVKLPYKEGFVVIPMIEL